MRLRPVQDDDVQAMVALALRAWAPVFASMRELLGEDMDELLTPDWRAQQREAVEGVVRDDVHEVLVAVDDDERPVGFVALRQEGGTPRTGVVEMVAVEPGLHRGGVGRALVRGAAEVLADAGSEVVMVETGGDPGHEPARALYEDVGFTLLPVARYFLDVRDGVPGG